MSDSQKFLPVSVNSNIRQPWMTSISRQLVIGLADNSPSMLGKRKSKDARKAQMALVHSLADPSNKGGFDIAFAYFAMYSRIVHQPTPATKLDGKLKRFSFLLYAIGGTNIRSAFKSADKIILDYQKSHSTDKITHLKPVVLLFSDGQHNIGRNPAALATQLRSKSTVVTIAFGADADEAGLRSWATSDQHFTRCSDGAELRSFLAVVGDTICLSRAAGLNTADELAKIN